MRPMSGPYVLDQPDVINAATASVSETSFAYFYILLTALYAFR